ncbi:MAG: PadR family transcriptional regulator [Rhodocyclaceae bacterium]|nr:PadR family transcriptional regulator [Rhodocyclaceae bacterium]
MSLDHALLVSLLEKPSSGYELARRFDKSIGHFWHATHQQIYKVLARMEEAGWIESEVHRGETAPDRKVFAVTPAGRSALAEWITEPSPIDRARSELMIKFRAAAFDDPRKLLPALAEHRAEHGTLLAAYRANEAKEFSGHDRPLSPQQELQYQVMKLGIAFEETWIAWCDETQALIHRIAPTPSATATKETS